MELDDDERYSELVNFRDTLEYLSREIKSKDIKETIDSIRFEFDDEISELEEEFERISRIEYKRENSEYWNSKF